MTLLRSDLKVIAELIPARSAVLDIGCGDGELLAWLTRNKQVDGRGMELSVAGVHKAVAQGLSVIQGDAESDLSYYPDASVDIAILSQSLQIMHDPRRMLESLVRIGKRAIVSVPNFGYWRNRFYLLSRGRMPVTQTLSYEWYDTPNIHFCTISDFVQLCEDMHIRIEQRVYVDAHGHPYSFRGRGWLANLFGEQGVFVLSKL